jgi:diguanylate cyclase (GGDEF)-like protein
MALGMDKLASGATAKGNPARAVDVSRFAKIVESAPDHTVYRPESERPPNRRTLRGTKVDASRFRLIDLMEKSELPPSGEATNRRSDGGSSPATLTDLLRRALGELSASAVGVTRAQGGPPRYFTRSAVAAQFFEDICSTGLEALKEQSQAKAGVFGTNRVKGDAQGPVRGRLIAVSLRSSKGVPLGILIATRLIDEPRFGAQESQKLLALASEFAAALTPPRPAIPEPPVVEIAVAAADSSCATVTTLLDWSAFERQIRKTEAGDRLPGCVIYGDMDQLHVINKLAGFAAGDRAISEAGAALQTAQLPPGSCSCHLSGDRYTVYVPHTTLAQARRIAEQLSKSVSGLSIEVHSVPTPLSISFGVAVIPATEGGLSHALAAAEAACKAAKDRGRGRVEVYQDADQSIVRRNDDVLVADRLRHALGEGRVEVFAQPIVRLHGQESSTHYELLMRLIGEAGTHLSPAWFMSAATRYRMLPELDRAVLQHIFGKLDKYRAALMKKKLRFSVNLSGPSIGDPDFIEWLGTHVGGAGVPGEWLQFEITETAAVANVAQTQALMRRLKARGVQFALDDFGTGVSSFAYLKFFDVKMLKLDGSFVRDLLANTRSESLVRGIAQLGRGMDIETVAECVETAAVRDRLAELGVDCAQGFFFGRPRPLEEVLAVELADAQDAPPATEQGPAAA